MEVYGKGMISLGLRKWREVTLRTRETLKIFSLTSLEDKGILRDLVNLYLTSYEGLERYAYDHPRSVEEYLRWLIGERGSSGYFRKGHVFLVGFLDNKELVSFVAGDSLWRDKELGEVGNFHELVVSPSHRRKGIAKVMVIELIRAFFSYDPHPRDVMLWVGVDNYPAMELYKKLGFEEVGVKGIWRKMRLPWSKVRELVGRNLGGGVRNGRAQG